MRIPPYQLPVSCRDLLFSSTLNSLHVHIGFEANEEHECTSCHIQQHVNVERRIPK